MQIVQALRQGDLDGLEDTHRKKYLDSLGFDWGDKSTHLRFRFVPLLIGLKVYVKMWICGYAGVMLHLYRTIALFYCCHVSY